jgi:hypothetical protein
VVLGNLQLVDQHGRAFVSSRLVVEASGDAQALVSVPTGGRMPEPGDRLTVRRDGSSPALFHFRFSSWGFNSIDPGLLIFYGTMQNERAAT